MCSLFLMFSIPFVGLFLLHKFLERQIDSDGLMKKPNILSIIGLFLLVILFYFISFLVIYELPYMISATDKDNKYEGKVEENINDFISKNLECQNLKIAAEELSEGVGSFEYADVSGVIASMKGNFLRIRLNKYADEAIGAEVPHKLTGVEYFSLDNSCKVDDVFLNKRDEDYSDKNVKWNKELVAKSTAFLTGFLKDLNELGGYKHQLKKDVFRAKTNWVKQKYLSIIGA